MKRLHISTAADILWSLQTGKPIAALCGYTRRISERRHARAVLSGMKTCRRCDRIMAAMVATGRATGPMKRTVAQLRVQAAGGVAWWSPAVTTTTLGASTYKMKRFS